MRLLPPFRPRAPLLSAERRFAFIPLWNIPVDLLYTMRRVDCPDCGVKVEKVPWADGKHATCNVFRDFLATWAKHLSWKDTARCFRSRSHWQGSTIIRISRRIFP